jgi:hypothetical protein
MSLATIIPVEIVNHILSFRPRHPVAQLIKNLWKTECDDTDAAETFLEMASVTRFYYRRPLVFKNMLVPSYLKNKDKNYADKLFNGKYINVFDDYDNIYDEYGTWQTEDPIYGDEDLEYCWECGRQLDQGETIDNYFIVIQEDCEYSEDYIRCKECWEKIGIYYDMYMP